MSVPIVKYLLDNIALDACVKPEMTMDEIFDTIDSEYGYDLRENDFEERDLATYLKDKGYNIVIDYKPVYKVGR